MDKEKNGGSEKTIPFRSKRVAKIERVDKQTALSSLHRLTDIWPESFWKYGLTIRRVDRRVDQKRLLSEG